MRAHRLIAAFCAVATFAALVSVAEARRIDRRSASAVLPGVDPVGRLRAKERKVRFSAVSAADAKIEIEAQVFCFNSKNRLKRKRKTFSGTGTVRGTIRRPSGKGLDCSASAAVRVRSRPTPPSGGSIPKIKLAATITSP